MIAAPDRERIGSILARARASGFSGFSGDCALAALAIRDVLLGGDGDIVGVFNRAFHAHGRSLGHVAVRVGEDFLDADGRLKEFADIESWGMLDEQDPDYAEMADELGIDWTEEASFETVTILFRDDDELGALFDLARREHLAAILAEAAREYEIEDESMEVTP